MSKPYLPKELEDEFGAFIAYVYAHGRNNDAVTLTAAHRAKSSVLPQRIRTALLNIGHLEGDEGFNAAAFLNDVEDWFRDVPITHRRRGRPSIFSEDNELMKVQGFRLPDSLDARVTARAEQEGISRAELARRAFEMYLTTG